MNKCEHGSSAWMPRELSGMLMNSPVDFCVCCGVTYYYCNEGAVGPTGSWGKLWTKGRCGACGGKYEFWDTRPKKVESEDLGTPRPAGVHEKTINELCQECNEAANSKGFSENTPGECIALMHSELSEALEEYRKGEDCWNIYYNIERPYDHPDKPEGLVVELADAVIRILHFCGKYKLDLEKAIEIKMEYNKTRPHKHGGKVI